MARHRSGDARSAGLPAAGVAGLAAIAINHFVCIRIVLTTPNDPHPRRRHGKVSSLPRRTVLFPITIRGKVLAMPVNLPFAASSGRDLSDKPRRIPKNVQLACLDMIHTGVDLTAAAKAHNIKPNTLRRHLHRIETIAFIRRERAAFRAALCSQNEFYLASIRSNSTNAMAQTKAISILEQIDDEARARPARSGEVASPGVVLNIIHQAPNPAPIVEIMPRSSHGLPNQDE